MARRGRPVDPNARRDKLIIRLNKDEANRLDAVSKSLGMNRSDTIRTLVENHEKKGD